MAGSIEPTTRPHRRRVKRVKAEGEALPTAPASSNGQTDRGSASNGQSAGKTPEAEPAPDFGQVSTEWGGLEVNVEPSAAAPTIGAARTRAYRSHKQADQAAAQSAMVMLTMFDGLISMALGPECALLPAERELIDEPLQRMLKRVDPTITGAIEKYTDPLLVTMGLITWGARVWQIQLVKMRAARAEREAQKPPVESDAVSRIEESLPVYDVPAPGLNVIGAVIP